MGIILGGSGQGEAMCANRVAGVRAAVFYGEASTKEAIDVDGEKNEDPFEIVRLARLHNDANILVLGSRFIPQEEAISAVQVFLSTDFEQGRHVNRLKKIEHL